MDWEKVGSTYADSVKSILPIHRLALVAVCILSLAVSLQPTHPSILESILAIKVSDLSGSESILSKNTTLLHMAVSGLLPLVASGLSNVAARGAFFLVNKTSNLEGAFRLASERNRPDCNADYSERIDAISFLEKRAQPDRRTLAAMNAGAETMFGLSTILVFASAYGNCIDLAIGIVLFALAMAVSFRALHFFIKHCYPSAYLISEIENSRPPKHSRDRAA